MAWAPAVCRAALIRSNGLGPPWELWLLTHEREKEALRIRTTLEFWEEDVSPAPVRAIPGATYLKTLKKVRRCI